ncbi:MAG TPA: hypothetical protein VJR92_09280 [Gemmatimonadaceae bacterium]|nr:hypothetical protein [Gemmatimonadaceae bacterium]
MSKTLIYKRTHAGDPGPEGEFGVYDCMGRVRAWEFDSVIGVGGIGDEPARHGLDGKVNWIGIGARKRVARGKRGPVVTFDRFRFFGSNGPSFAQLAPTLSRRVYERNIRALTKLVTAAERREVNHVLQLAANAQPSTRQKSAGKRQRARGITGRWR